MAIFELKNTLYTCKGVGMSYIHDLDALAAANVIEFDAPSYIRGTAPRYVGNPPLEMISDQLAPIKQQPKRDEFVKEDPHHNPVWKKVLFGAVAIGTVIASVVLGKKLVKNIKMPTFKGIKRSFKRLGKRIRVAYNKSIKWIKNTKLGQKVAGWFKKPAATPTPPTP